LPRDVNHRENFCVVELIERMRLSAAGLTRPPDSVVAPQRRRTANVAKVAGLAQNADETFGDALPLFEFPIVLRLRFTSRLSWLLRPVFPAPPHCTASNSNTNRLRTLAARELGTGHERVRANAEPPLKNS
jgi:hypothetical protein